MRRSGLFFIAVLCVAALAMGPGAARGEVKGTNSSTAQQGKSSGKAGAVSTTGRKSRATVAKRPASRAGAAKKSKSASAKKKPKAGKATAKGKAPSRTKTAKKTAEKRPAKSGKTFTIPEVVLIGPDEGRRSILVVGDSLAVGVGMFLGNAFEGSRNVRIRNMGKVSSGLDSPEFYDWMRVLRDSLDRERYDLVVVMLGANDAHNSTGSAEWGASFQVKFREFLKILAGRKVPAVILGLPPMGKSDFERRVLVANQAMKDACRSFPQGCTYVDTFGLFSDGSGNYTDSLPVQGVAKKVRAGDGVHFTGTGYLLLSRRVVDESIRLEKTSLR